MNELTKMSQEELIKLIQSNNTQDPYERDNKGKILNTYNNLLYFIQHNDELSDNLKFNEFLQRKEYKGQEFTDFEMNHIYALYDQQLGIKAKGNIDVVVSEIFSENRYNPVKEYINNLEWDGKERVERLFIDLLEADDTELNRKMTIKWFMAAVKRVLYPGCKFDNMIVIRGGQGIGKSTICERIANSFFSTISLGEIGSKDIINKLNKSWICIIDEMDTFNRKEMSTIKTFLSTSKDTARLAYARNANTYERHCVFIGSTNDDTFLRDNTSSVERRFWVIDCKKQKFDKEAIAKITPDFVSQLWAEASHKLKDDTYLDIESELLEEFARQQVEFKTYTTDVAIDYTVELLEKSYNSPKSATEFYVQATDTLFVNGTKLDKIPASWLIHCLKKTFNVERTAKYLGNALAEKWVYKNAKIDGRTHKCFVRRKNELFEDEDE